jgi:hypothetical protein
MDEGAFDQLEGAGRPLPAEDGAGQDPAMRMAHRLMKNAGITPEWIAEGRAIEREVRRLEGVAGEERARRIGELNRRIALFNLKVPVRSAQKMPAR